MNLFGDQSAGNLLPYDGTVNYHGVVISAQEAWEFFETLLSKIPWEQDETVIFGKRIATARKVAWYGDSDFEYAYSGTSKRALPWNDELRRLKTKVEQCSGDTFNSCLLNLYHHGGEGMGWHSDDEKLLKCHAAIASVSLGAERKFSFRHKRTGETLSVILEHGSLLVMKDETQTHWQHMVPKTTKVREPRINLTFRTIEA
ncbi:MAG: alpha-ketoglutarate-dependent dioxygenase AlkB [Luteolibacter sp.]